MPKHPRVSVTPREPTVEALGNQEVVLIDKEEEVVVLHLDRKRKGVVTEPKPSKKMKRVDTHGLSTDLRIPSKVDEYPAPPHIILTPAHPDEERVQLRIAKHNYTVGELSRGDTEAEAPKKRLMEAQYGPFQGEYAGDIWDLNLDPLTDWFKRFVGTNLALLASEMDQMEALRNEAQEEKALVEQNHQAALKVKDDIIASSEKNLRDSREENHELLMKLQSLEVLHQTDLETTTNLTIELKELREFWDKTRKKAAKAERDALLAPVTCKHYEKCFEDGACMCWKANKFEPRLHFFPNPEAVIAQF
uniref:Uncharacterized protein n=1 Tax=Cannabis sativa TaxID=3483 RepID=A0A803QQ71_CANSA